ncbi:hypothetical protein V9T40_007848 [Parthenolecanium corni]|uniref:Meiosis-specific with OB domain-containing protein n=1 Tax=Parthenolecanium corni TaxID=536013 RepID=A0AAN9Y6I0_9HEMI
METSGIVNTKICDIGPGNDNLFLQGIIVRTQEAKIIRMKRDNNERCVWSFTLRDSPQDLINVSAWGTPMFIQEIASKWKINDIVDLLNVKVVIRRISNNDDQYQPSVRSSFSITFNEGQSDIRPASSNVDDLVLLSSIPTKSVDSYLIISDIHSNGEKLKKQYVNVLAALQRVGATKQFRSKDGRSVVCKDLTLIDETYETITVTLWNEDLIHFSQTWTQQNTVLFLADVRVEWSDFRKAITLATTGKTVITENPSTTKAESLRNFLTAQPLQGTGKLDQIINKYTDLSVINSVMSCEKIISKGRSGTNSNEFTAVVYALLNFFDIDGPESFIATKCMRCQWKVDPSMELCLNANCQSVGGDLAPLFDQVYDIRVTLTDHTGSLVNCRLNNEAAVRMIGCKASQFPAFSEIQKTSIKWKFLLKYCTAKVVVLPLSGKDTSIITVMSLDTVSLSQYSSLVPLY